MKGPSRSLIFKHLHCISILKLGQQLFLVHTIQTWYEFLRKPSSIEAVGPWTGRQQLDFIRRVSFDDLVKEFLLQVEVTSCKLHSHVFVGKKVVTEHGSEEVFIFAVFDHIELQGRNDIDLPGFFLS